MGVHAVSAEQTVIWHSAQFVDVAWSAMSHQSHKTVFLVVVGGLACIAAYAGLVVALGPLNAFLILVLIGAILIAISVESLPSNKAPPQARPILYRRAEAIVDRLSRELSDPIQPTSNHKRVARKYVDALFAGKENGLTVRINVADPTFPPSPIDVHFEPRLLNEAEEDMHSLPACGGIGATTDGKAPPAAVRSGFFDVGSLRRSIRLGNAAFLVISLWQFIMAVLRAGSAGTPDIFVFFWLVFVLVAMISFLRVSQVTGSQPFALPGGLVVRSYQRGARQATLRRFTRQESVLVVCRGARAHQWAACVCDASGHHSFTLTLAEVDFLLRAWLSPLPTPTVEQMSDLL